jgi:hypothetical protein
MAKSLYYFYFKSHGYATVGYVSLPFHSKFLRYFVQYSGGPPKKIHIVSVPEKLGTPALDYYIFGITLYVFTISLECSVL